jgi:general secretion pathway protein A
MYTAFYNLKEQPFRLTPDPRFLHLAEPHRIALKVLLEGVLLRKGFLVMVGPVGTGKTTMLHAALHMLSERSVGTNRLATAFLVNPTLTRDEFFEAVLDEFEITSDSSSKPRRLAALHQMLLETQQRGATAVLFVDEAHLLPPDLLEEIRLLSNADTYQEKLLQIVLCGQPELSTLLDRDDLRALRQRIAARCELRPLSLPETRAYITERLYAAGLRGPGPFAGAALEAVYEVSGGVPRLINLLCDGSLSIGFALRQKQIERDIVDEAASNLGLLSVPATPTRPPSETGLQPDQKDKAPLVSNRREFTEPPLSPTNSGTVAARPETDESEKGLLLRDLGRKGGYTGPGLPSATPVAAASEFVPRPTSNSMSGGSEQGLGQPLSSVRVMVGVPSRMDGSGSKLTPAPSNGAGRVNGASIVSPLPVPSHSAVASAGLKRDRSRSTLELLCDAFRQGRAAARE